MSDIFSITIYICSIMNGSKYVKNGILLALRMKQWRDTILKKNIGVKFVLLLGRHCEEKINRWSFRTARRREISSIKNNDSSLIFNQIASYTVDSLLRPWWILCTALPAPAWGSRHTRCSALFIRCFGFSAARRGGRWSSRWLCGLHSSLPRG